MLLTPVLLIRKVLPGQTITGLIRNSPGDYPPQFLHLKQVQDPGLRFSLNGIVSVCPVHGTVSHLITFDASSETGT